MSGLLDLFSASIYFIMICTHTSVLNVECNIYWQTIYWYLVNYLKNMKYVIDIRLKI